MDSLFLNHLHFFASHRGSIRIRRRDVMVEGPFDELNAFVPSGADRPIPQGSKAVRLAPWSGASWSERLPGEGFAPAEALTYMELGDPHLALPATAEVKVRHVEDEAGARTFAAIQEEAFESGPRWGRFLRRQALANWREPDQRFYLGYWEGEPVTTTLALLHAGVCGLYAVSTRPAFRRSGVAGAVLEQVRREMLAAGWRRFVLQANTGSEAEAYYARRGFRDRFVSQVWRKAA